MLVTLTQYSTLAQDKDGVVLPLGKGRIACEAKTAVGAFTALNVATRFVRLATDTAIQMDIAGGTTTAADELFVANSVEFIAVNGGETLTIAAA